MHRPALVAALLGLLLSLRSAAQCQGLAQFPSMTAAGPEGISGRVIDLEGRPVVGAAVQAQEFNRPHVGLWPEAQSDDEGKFVIRGLTPGTYWVIAVKEDDYYPDISWTFYATGKPLPEYEVRPGEMIENVEVKVGPKVARLNGRVIDDVTLEPVVSIDPKTGHRLGRASVDFYEAETPQMYLGMGADTKGEFSVLVPTKPFRMKVSAPGYETWYYGKDGLEEHADVILVPSATTRELVIPLRRVGP